MAKYEIGGISLSLSSFETGLWFDHDEDIYQPAGWGIRFHIVWGKWMQPIPRFWEKGWWDVEHNVEHNYWKGGKYWFVLRVPFMIAPFISIALGKYGFYLGWKTYGVTKRLNTPERYGKWIRENECGELDDECRYLQLSATIRATRWK